MTESRPCCCRCPQSSARILISSPHIHERGFIQNCKQHLTCCGTMHCNAVQCSTLEYNGQNLGDCGCPEVDFMSKKWYKLSFVGFSQMGTSILRGIMGSHTFELTPKESFNLYLRFQPMTIFSFGNHMPSIYEGSPLL